MKKISLLTAFLFAISFAQAQLQTKSVSVFKNNKAFFIKSGTVSPKGTQYQLTGEMPGALFGTLWFASPGNAIKLVSSSEQNIEKQGTPINHYEILKANLNKKVMLYLSPTETVEGIVQAFSENYDKESKTYFIPAFVTIKGNSIWQSVKIEDIKRIGFAENPVTTVTSYEKKKVVTVEFAESKAQPLSMMYLEDGLNWSPNYLLELTSENKGILTLQAQVKNDAEDIANTDVSFVVGNANFKDANKLAWLVDFSQLTWNFGDGDGEGSGNGNGPGYDNTLMYKSAADESAKPSTEGDGLEGESSEDLFFYNLKNLTLPKGSRAQMELFRAEISFEHVYEANLSEMSAYNLENYVYQIYATEDVNAKTYHSLKLNNQTKYPWTAGLCFVVNTEKGSQKPISQDVLTYTPIKGDNSLKLTESPDIKVSQTEKETERKTNIRKRGDVQYDLITVEAEIKIKNYKAKDVKMKINRIISGELLKSNVDWKKTDKINYSNYLNKTSAVTWETNVKAGEEKVIKYSYTIVVRAN